MIDASKEAARASVERIFRDERGRVLAALVGVFRDFQIAEDALHDALVIALERWPVDGVPRNPGAWLTTTARHRAVDKLRRDRRVAGGDEELVRLPALEAETDEMDAMIYPDERLKLIFTCCHPALAQEAQVALTLRTLGGLSTEEIARAFLTPVPTMAQRLVRAQRKIRDAGIPFEVPERLGVGERVASVLAVVYLIFNAGYEAGESDDLMRLHLCEDAIGLGRTLVSLLDDLAESATVRLFRPEAMGLLALMRLHHARRRARVSPEGALVLLEAQDRSLWDQQEVASAVALLDRAMMARLPGPYQIQAAIAALHAQSPAASDTDWRQIAALYAALAEMTPSPVIELNRAVAVAMADGPLAGLMQLDRAGLDSALAEYHLYHAARADLLRRLGMRDDALSEYRQALDLCRNATERAFLQGRIASLDP